MNRRDAMMALLRGEVFRVEQGTESISMLHEREDERELERQRLRSAIDVSHPELPGAVKRRGRVM